MGFLDELLRLASFVEAHLFFYLIKTFPELGNGTDFKLDKTISVSSPFGRSKTRDQNGLSQIQPEICVTSETLGFVAEAAAWDDDAEYGNKQSESHQAMHKIDLDKDCVYFAQKVICQILPVFIYCKNKTRDCHAFLSFTENHKDKMDKVLSHLISKNFLESFKRPLITNNEDLKLYHQVIYELNFPEKTDDIINKINKLSISNAS